MRKLGHSERVVAQYRVAGVPEERLTLLAAILLVGAAGLLVGLAAGPIGVARCPPAGDELVGMVTFGSTRPAPHLVSVDRAQ